MKIQPYKRRAHYYETDQMQVVHHSNYIRWFEEARVDMMDQMGFSYAKMEALGVLSPLTEARCQYKKMVRFHEEVMIYAALTKFTGIKMTVAYKVVLLQSGQVAATGETHHGFIDGAGNLISLKKDYPDIYHLLNQYIEQT